MSQWINPAVALPDDGEEVYVRQKLFSIQTPLEAVFQSATNSFLMPNGLLLSWEWCSAWLPR